MAPEDEIYGRIEKLQAAMQSEEIGGALILQRADLYYFSGTAQNAHLFVPAKGEPALIVKRSLLRAEHESALEKIIPFTGWDKLADLIAESIPAGSKLGLELDVLPANNYFRYKKLFSNYKLTDLSGEIRRLRTVKSDYEIGLMYDAAKLSEAVFEYAASVINAGMREVELAGHLEMKARTLGHQGAVRMRGFNQELYYGHIMTGANAAAVSFFDGPTGGSGLNSSYPQGAGATVIERHEPVLIDFVSVFNGYMVDQTRIFCVGEPAPHLMSAYKTALDIKARLIEIGNPGTKCSALYQEAEQLADAAGLIDYFMGYVEKVGFVGHGVGLELDEMPVIAKNYNLALKENMVFALEPKFIFPGEGTVGLEDTFKVGPGGLEQITRFSEDIISI